MSSIFVSHSFRDDDRQLAETISTLVKSHGITPVTGLRLGGGLLLPAIRQKIEEADGLIALFTRREPLPGGRFTTHPWVFEEITIARDKKRRTVSLIEDDVDPGPESQFQFFQLNRQALLPALLALSDTVGQWRNEAGRTVKVQILPSDLALQIGNNETQFRCRFRLGFQDQMSGWDDNPALTPVLEESGTFFYLKGVRDGQAVQIEVRQVQGPKRWVTHTRSPWATMVLQEVV